MRMKKMAVTSRYSYVRGHECGCEAVDAHHIICRRSSSAARGFLFYLFASLLFADAFYIFVIEDITIMSCFFLFALTALLVKLMLWKPVIKESVLIFPALGVQLETHYGSGSVARCFVPIGKILKPVLVECVTPVTCYWSLSLILRDEEEMVLVFKELRPQVRMMVPVWKALCAAVNDMGI